MSAQTNCFSLVIFDLDGTLIDAFEDITAAANFIRSRNNLPALSIDEVKNHVGHGARYLVEGVLDTKDTATVDENLKALVGYYEGEDLTYAGKVGMGFDTPLLLSLRERLDALEVAAPPFTRAIGLPRLGAHWVRPEIVVQVAFMEWTVHGKLRHPRFVGIRSDKPARAVCREEPDQLG